MLWRGEELRGKGESEPRNGAAQEITGRGKGRDRFGRRWDHRLGMERLTRYITELSDFSPVTLHFSYRLFILQLERHKLNNNCLSPNFVVYLLNI